MAGSNRTSAAGESKVRPPPVQGSVAGRACQPVGESIDIPWIEEANLEEPANTGGDPAADREVPAAVGSADVTGGAGAADATGKADADGSPEAPSAPGC